MKSIFIAGTDTSVGKTFITGLLGRFFTYKNYRVITQKWVQTGSVSFSKDIAKHLKLMGLQRTKIREHLKCVCPYILKYPASPDLAAKMENKKINASKIKKCFYILQNNFELVIVEGIGGVLVPLNKNKLVIDVVAELKIPTIVVVANKLGAINHTLLTIEALRRRKIQILGLVFNNYKKTDSKILDGNILSIQHLTKEKILGIIPKIQNKTNLQKVIAPIGRKIIKKLQKYEKNK